MAAKKKSSDKASKRVSKTVAKTATTKSATARTAVSKTTTASQPAARKKAVAKKTAAKKKVSNKLTSTPTAVVKKKTAAKKATTTSTATAKTAVKKKTARKSASTPVANSAAGSLSNGQFKTFSPYEAAKDEEYMSQDQLQHFRGILLNWKQSLMEEVDRTVGHMKSDATNFPDPNDRATQEEEFSLELRTRDRERKLIKKIDESIVKIDEDEYGFCDGCGVDIGIRRLEARPTANMCIECKTLEEIREKQIA